MTLQDEVRSFAKEYINVPSARTPDRKAKIRRCIRILTGRNINFGCSTCYIDSTCTYGAYGYNITLKDCTNNAATPVYNLTSGGSIKEWDGQALPSIADATGGQVLALKSDKSALEFATVSGGGMDPIVASLIFG